MSEVKITALKNGPYKVEGPIALYDGATPLAPRTPATFLCRCGASSTKPYCDGTHGKIGFQAVAVPPPDSAP